MDVYASFSEELRRAQANEFPVLDEEDGLIVRWSAICEQTLQALALDLTPEEAESWTLERNTWQLVQALYVERLAETAVPDSPTPQGSTSQNPYTPLVTVAQKLIERNKDLIELSAIRDWLHSIPTSLNPAEIRRSYLPYTKNKLKQARRTGSKAPRGLVEDLDPDATLRGSATGARLEGDDATYERALLRSLFEYVRAGELDLAIDMCRQSDQSWRAASLAGGRLSSDPGLAPAEGFDDGMDMEGEEKRAAGNLNRRLWKKTCRKLASSPGLDPHERALYGAISGDVPSVLPVCTSWEDVVWAHVNALLESNIEAGLWTASEGRYWSRGSVKEIEASKMNLEDPLLSSAGRGASVRSELESIFDKMMRNEKGDIALSAKNPFHVSQTYLIVNKISDLLTTFVDRLEQAAMDTEPETLAHLLRFFAHLILVLRMLEQPLPEYAANRILEAYVNVLEANDQDESLIAFYASKLDSSSAVESYARFLLTFGPESDRESRRLALLKAREHGLDLAKIACRTVDLVLADLREELPELDAVAPFDAYARIDARQTELIRSLEWLTFDSSTYKEALSQANALARYFLSTDKPHAARELMFQLPSDLLQIAVASKDEDDDLQSLEYTHYSSLFQCLEKHTRWAEVWARKPRPSAPKLDHAAFRDGVANLIDDFHASTIDLLEEDWLKFRSTDDGTGNAQWRSAELARIRQLVIPHLVLRLHHTLYETRDVLPGNLARALSLANTVADERFQLYLEFVTSSGNKIGEYLSQVLLWSILRGSELVEGEAREGLIWPLANGPPKLK